MNFVDLDNIYEKQTIMGTSKNHLYTDHINLMASLFWTLGHGARLTILEYLLEHDTATNKQLVEHLGLSQSTVSEHLKHLKDFRLIVAIPHENSIVYSLHAPMWNHLIALARAFGAEEQGL